MVVLILGHFSTVELALQLLYGVALETLNMLEMGCKMRKDKADRFKMACKLAGTTPNAVFTKAVNAFLGEKEEAGD